MADAAAVESPTPEAVGRLDGRSGQIYFHHRVAEYREMWRAVAKTMDGTFTELGPDVWQIDADGARTRIQNHQMECDNPEVLALAGRTPLVHRLIRSQGLEARDDEVLTLADLGPAMPGSCEGPG